MPKENRAIVRTELREGYTPMPPNLRMPAPPPPPPAPPAPKQT